MTTNILLDSIIITVVVIIVIIVAVTVVRPKHNTVLLTHY